ncbi:MAG: hypothetical protein U0230_24725 [Polyangiales bacterium]
MNTARSNGLAALLVGIALAAVASLARPASAQEIPTRGLRLALAGELGNGRMPLLPPNGVDKPKAEESLLLGARISADYGFGERLSLETAFAADWYAMKDFAVYELDVAPRIRWIERGYREWYIRPVVGVGFAAPVETHVGLVAGLGFGFRRQLTERLDAFVEIGYRLRWFRHYDAAFAADTWQGYGMPSAEAPNGLACFLGVTAGVGLGVGGSR